MGYRVFGKDFTHLHQPFRLFPIAFCVRVNLIAKFYTQFQLYIFDAYAHAEKTIEICFLNEIGYHQRIPIKRCFDKEKTNVCGFQGRSKNVLTEKAQWKNVELKRAKSHVH